MFVERRACEFIKGKTRYIYIYLCIYLYISDQKAVVLLYLVDTCDARICKEGRFENMKKWTLCR